MYECMITDIADNVYVNKYIIVYIFVSIEKQWYT